MADTERPLIFRADGKVVEGAPPMLWDGVFGLLKEDLQDHRARGQLTAMAQLFELVAPGLILTRHIFRGLQRPLYCDDDPQGDERKLIYTRCPSADYEWIGGLILRRVGQAPRGPSTRRTRRPRQCHQGGAPPATCGWCVTPPGRPRSP
jgi:hypothetical protein